MHKLPIRWQRIPPKFRTFVNILLCFLCLCLIYVSLGSPAFSVRDAFRRQEKANLVGPSEILVSLRMEDMAYDHLVLAEDDTGVTLFTYNFWNSDATELVYIPKRGSLTLAAVPGFEDLSIRQSARVPLVLFDSEPQAARAEIDLFLSGTFESEFYRQQYSLASSREYDDLFLFTIEATSLKSLWAEGYLLTMLQNAERTPTARISDVTASAHVKLYNDRGDLIAEQDLTLLAADRG